MKQKKKLIATIVSGVILVGLTASLILLAVFQNRKQPQEVVDTGFKPNVEWYDEEGREFTLTTAVQLYELAQLSHYYDFAGQTIKLGADIVVNEGNAADWEKEAPKRSWYPIYDFAGTFDGQGHTISGIYAKMADTSLAMFANTKVGSVVQNFKLENSYFYAWGSKGTASIASNSNGTFKQIYSDAIVYCENGYAAGMFSKPQDGTVIEECWFDGSVYLKERFGGGITDIARGTKLTIEHCLNAGTIESPWEESAVSIGGICGVVMDMGGRLKINDCLNVGTITVSNTFRVGAIVGGGNDKVSVDVRNAYATKESYVLGIGNVIYNNTGGAIRIEEETLKGIGAYQWTTLDFDKYWAAVENSTPVLKCFAEEPLSVAGAEKLFSFDWYDETATEYVLKTREDLFGFTLMSHITNFRDKTVKLGADITVNKGNALDWMKKAPKLEWMPIQMFAGTFDGQRHTISGIYLHGDVAIGLFEKTNKYSTIKNFYLKNSYFHGTGGEDGYAFVGSIVGRGGGVIDTVYSNAIVSTVSLGAGGFIGQMNINDENNRITNCWFDGTVNMIGESAIAGGGMVGSAVQGKLTVEHCLNTGRINSSVKNRGAKVGGFVANLEFNKARLAIKDCLSVGKITTNNQFYVGSIIGVACASTSAAVDKAFASTEAYLNPSGRHVSVNTSGTGTITGGGINIDQAKLVGFGGFQWTELNFDKYWVVQTEGTPMLKSFAKGKAPSLAGIPKFFDTSWYDKKSDVYTLDSKEELYGFAMLSGTTDFEGKTIKLGANITLNTGNASDWSKSAPVSDWSPIKKFAGTFDGQGNTISGVYLSSSASVAGLFETVTGTVQNLRLENSYFHSTEDILGSVAGRGQGATFKNIYSDAILESDKGIVGGIVGQLNTEKASAVEECWFAGSASAQATGVGGIVGGIIYADTTIKNCLNTGTIISTEEKNPFAGGLCGYINMGGHLAITDSMDVGNFDTKTEAYVGSLVGYIGGAPTYEFMNAYASKHSVDKAGGNTKQKGAIQMDLEAMKGLTAYMLTDLDFTDVWVARDGQAPALKSFVAAEEVVDLTNIKPADTKWSKKKALEISTREELYGFAKLSLKGNTFEGKTITVKDDITINGGDISTWQYVWNPLKDFAGTFDGGENTISGIYVKSNSENAGMFEILTGTVQNLAIADSSIHTTENDAGTIAGRSKGASFKNIYSTATVASDKGLVGGIVGRVGGTKSALTEDTIVECWFGGTVQAKTTGAGGLAGGIIYSDIKVTDSLNTGTVSSEATENPFVGGLCGYINMGGNLAITDSLNTGDINVGADVKYVGSLVGFIGGSPVTYEFEETFATKSSYKNLVGNGRQEGAFRLETEYLQGVNGYILTAYDFEETWAARAEDTPVLKNWVTDSTDYSHIEQADTAWYAKGKPIMDQGDMLGFMKLALLGEDFEGDIVELGATVTVAQDDAKKWTKEKSAEVQWIPIKNFAGTFDGGKNTIHGIYVNDAIRATGLFRTVTGTVENLIMSDSFIYSTADRVGCIAGNGQGATFRNIYSTATVSVTAEAGVAGGIVGLLNTEEESIVEECWFAGKVRADATGVGGVVGGVLFANTTIQNCLNTGTVISTVSGDAFAGGICGYINMGGHLTVKDSVSIGKLQVEDDAKNLGSIVGFIGGTPVTYSMTDVYAEAKVCNALVGNGRDKGAIKMDAEAMKGISAYMLVDLDFHVNILNQGIWVARKDAAPALKNFADESEIEKLTGVKPADTKWYENGTYKIETKEELYGLAKLSLKGNSFEGKTISIVDDIPINSGDISTWQYVWNPLKDFAGTLDGGENTIFGIYVKSDSENAGMFEILTGTVQNLAIADSSIRTTENNAGSIAGRSEGATIQNIYSTATVASDKGIVGGIVGRVGGVKDAYTEDVLQECWFGGTVQAKTTGAGSIVGGVIYGNVDITDCLNTGIVKSSAVSNAFVGGLCGYINMGGDLAITDSLNTGTIEVQDGAQYVGSLVGFIGGNPVSYSMTNVYAETSIYDNLVGNGKQDGAVAVKGSELYGLGAYMLTDLTFYNSKTDSGVWAAYKSATPVLKNYATGDLFEVEVSTEWYTSSSKTIMNAADLYGFAKLSQKKNFAGETIKLGAPITVNEGLTGDDRISWEPIGQSVPFDGTFDGDGHTISGIYMNTDEAVSGLFGEVRGTVRNFTLSSSEFKSTATYFGAIVGYGRGNMDTIYVDDTVTIESSASECGGLVGRYGSTSTATISNCWFAGTVTSSAQYCGGIAGRVENGQKSIVNCMSSGTISSAVAVDQVAFAGGMVGGVYSDNGKLTTTFTMNDCLNTAKVDATSPYGVGSVIGRARNIKTVTIEQTYTTNESSSSVGYVTSTSGYVGIGNASAVNKGETDASGSPDNAYAVTGTPILKTDVNLEGAEGYKNTQLNFWVKEGDTGLWVARKNATPALKSFIDKTEWNKDVNLNVQRVHTDWYYNNLNTEEKTYTIGTVAEFYGLAEIVNNDGRTFAADETVYLTNDIVINSGEFNKNTWMKWQPILSFAGTFDGMYEGKIHTISGIYIDETSTTEVGLFRIVTGSIKNLGLKNSYIFSTKNNTGSIAGELRGGQLFNVYSNAKVTGSGQVTGGIIGRVKTTASTLTGCWFDGEVQSSNLAAGGIAGGAIMHVTFKDCLNTGSVTNTVSANAWTGGICGYNNNGGIVTVENCINTGKIIASNTSGAILGRSNVKNGFVVTSAYASSQSCATAYSGNAPATAVTTFDENAYKGIAGTQFSTLNFAAPTETNPIQWVLRTGAVPGVISWTSASEKIVADTTWYDTSDVTLGTTTNPYMLATKEEFYGFAKLAFEGNTFSGKTIQLVNSLTFNGVTENTDVSGWKATPPVDIWIPIKEFAGTFDGQNKTISGIYINESSTAEVGLFRIVTGCIKNFGLKSSYIASTKNNTGSIVGELRGGQLLNVYSNAKVTSSGQVTGGIIGRVKTTASTLTGCWFDGEVEASNLAAGGIAGGAIMHVTFKDCLNTGSVTNTISANAWTGGICGYNNNGAVVTIENCINTGIITASNTCGSILGQSNVNNGFKTTNVYASTQSCAVTHSGKAPSTTIATFDEELYKESEGTKFSTLNFATPTVENPIQWVLRKDAIPGLADWTPSSDKLVTNTN